MVNKEYFENELSNTLNTGEEKTKIISTILEENFIIGKKSKEQIISSLKEKLNITDVEADKIYNKSMEIIKTGIKEKLKHPFKTID